jgi:hypothetical protein
MRSATRSVSCWSIARPNFALERHRMITCYLRYQIDPDKVAEYRKADALLHPL